MASPLVKKQQALGKGKGGRITPPSVGHLFGFGSTEGYYRAKVLGLRRRGRPGKAFDPETGQGYVPRVRGDYHDAIHIKRATVILLLVEIFGGISPQAVAHIGHLAMRAKGGRDTTRYGHSRTSARSYFVHHTQRISLAAVLQDARAIRRSIRGRRRDYHAGLAGAAP